MPVRFFGGKSPFWDVERAPLSVQDDDDDLMHLPPYSDNPTSDQRNGSETAIGSGGGGNPADGDENDQEAGGDEGESLQLNGDPAKRYRAGLVRAYLKYWFACRCCDASGARGLPTHGPGASKSPKSRRIERVLMGLFYLFALAVCLLCASAIGYIIAQEGNPFLSDLIANSGMATSADFSTALEADCSAASLRTLEGIQMCHDKCQAHLCCFADLGFAAGNGHCDDIHDHDESCGTYKACHADTCAAYEPCKGLVTLEENALNRGSTGDATATEVVAAVEKSCTLPDDPALIDGAWVTGCHAACVPRLCCVLDPRLGSSCRGAVECPAYAPCKVLIDANKGQVTKDPHAIGNVDNVCSADMVQDSKKRSACEFLCKQRSCCFEEEAAHSCYGMVSFCVIVPRH